MNNPEGVTRYSRASSPGYYEKTIAVPVGTTLTSELAYTLFGLSRRVYQFWNCPRVSEAREEAVGKGLRSWPVGGAGEPPAAPLC